MRTELLRIGMTTMVIVFALAGVARAQPATSPAASAFNIDNGRSVYERLPCQTCHGVDGSGTAAGPRLAASPLELSAFVAYVREPKGTMPAQAGEIVSDQELTAIYAFLHSPSLRAGRAAPEPSPGSVEAGALAYRKNGCYECHVDEAQGGPQGPRLGPNPIPMQSFMTYVRNPTGSMPPFTATVLPDAALASIYAFLQARPVPPPVASIPLLAP
jgi:mono/diheme cytochrome c family protein